MREGYRVEHSYRHGDWCGVVHAGLSHADADVAMGTPVTQTQQEIVALLARRGYTMAGGVHGEVLGQHTHIPRVDLDVQWVIDAVTLLLRIELERQA